ncbi:DUF4215 domain-containing protein [Myxococcus sp. MISCRS1]|uniref:DUF4215 domain-containing protein n=1 Tax=Myxococcus sp. MISCRS1 TaxID=2996786 RepID=UPI00226E80B7|nr:DUF4215 domain-containing protein [Myxococcus sp. MISCRS1]MCY1001153.1 DUF4215 domain-containing protein [Myxococcus sp. MISCRS1]
MPSSDTHPIAMKRARTGPSVAALALALITTLTGCQEQQPTALVSTEAPGAQRSELAAPVVGDGRIQPGEECDDGNTVSGDGCSATGTIEAGYLCHVPGRACSLASLCGNNEVNPGEACDDGNTTQEGNGCSTTCDLSLCGNGAFNNRQWPNFDQEVCDDGNRTEGDGCNRMCEVEPGFACSGTPSRCVRAGIAFFNTGVDQNNRRLESGADPHWFYSGTTTGAAVGARSAEDWPQEIQTATFMVAPLGAPTCVYQDFIIPSTTNVAQFRMRIATFNDNSFDGATVNGQPFTPVTVSEPPGSPWQKSIIREFGTTAAWKTGLNRLELCNENEASPPNAFRYLFVDAYDDRCGDGVVSPREECDDGDTSSGDGCSATCGIEPGYGCSGQPSSCAATCGNGLLNSGEQCDDGNLTPNDGCNASCRVESGYACPTPGQACVATCGNGAVDPGELCDDGNNMSGDGCSNACRVENGYECSGAPSNCAPTCGNGVLNPGELCDDGNTNLGDGCSNACTLELGYTCPTVGQPCVKTCGNGTVDPGETCDDGNLNPGDGCATECKPEPGYSCSRPASGPSVCVATCGNGAVDANEECDDNNTSNGDGCSQGCAVESGYQCSGAPSTCTTVCGDGIRAGAETCDDGNTVAGDGCSATCAVEPGYSCPPPGNVCSQTCGNGVVNPGETCDDNNTTSGDGCSNTCAQEPGYTCSGQPSTCATTCGDGTVAGGEVCDDGNLESGDTCSPRCLWSNGQPCAASGVCDSGLCNPYSNVCISANVCGNGLLDEGEQCDDGDTTANDGCSATCTVETGYSCAGQPSACAVTCGDGIKAAAEACDDGNTTAGDGCSATCTIEAGHGCKNTDVHALYTRLGRSQCTNVSDIAQPDLAALAAEAALTVPGRYRAAYVSGAVSYSGTDNWYPGLFGFNHVTGAGTQRFTLGRLPLSGPASATRDAAMGLGFGHHQDFDALSGEVRLALVDTDCADNNNTETQVAYRVDSLSICQLIPVLTDPAPGGVTDPVIGGTGSPGSTIDVYVDGGTTPVCTVVVDAAGRWTCDLGNIPEGTHSVVLTSTEVGATETAPPATIIVELTPPTTPVITGPANGSTVSTGTPPISGTSAPGTTVTVREGTTVVCTATTDASGNWSCTPTTPLPDGSHTLTATAVTPEGSTSETSAPTTFIVDTTAPGAPVISGPAGGSTVSTGTPPISGTSEPGATVTVREGGTVVCTATADASGNWSCTPTTPLSEGPHTLTATATDGAGNTSPPSAPVTFTVSTTVPGAPVITGPANGSVLADATPAISGTATPGATVTVREGTTVVCTATADASGNWSCTPTTPLADGSHAVTATATDPTSGNESGPSNVDTFRIDTQAPDTSFSRTPGASSGNTESPFAYASNEEGVTFECSLDNGPYVACQDTYDVREGEHVLRVRAIDSAGNVDPTPAEHRWTVLNSRAFAGGGCSAAPASSAGLALLALLGLRRRKARR